MATAKLFRSGRSQAVRIPKEFRFEGKEVRIRRAGNGVLLEPLKQRHDWKRLFDDLDRLTQGEFMAAGREQPAMAADRNPLD
jgi:antitoxin VapB